MAYAMRELTAAYSTRLFINDRVDIAMAVAADGVHLGGLSMPAYAAGKAAGEGMLIGASAHSMEAAAKAAEEGADFITFGPVFETPSKMRYGKPQGLDRLTQVSRALSVPVFAIGGIKKDNIMSALESGASGVAVISAILGAEDIKTNTEEFMRLLK